MVEASKTPIIIWFRRDLRLTDNPALATAAATKRPLICLYIREAEPVFRAAGGASDWWLDKSLRALQVDIEQRGGQLTLRTGDAASILNDLIAETGANTVLWNRRYDKAERDYDAALKTGLTHQGIQVESFNAALLNEPWVHQTGSGGYYKVFSPYWRAIKASYTPPKAHTPPDNLVGPNLESEPLDDWGLHPKNPDWSAAFSQTWQPGEAGAAKRLETFFEHGLANYGEDRNRPDLPHSTSGLSPHLAFGEIGPAQIWRATKARETAGQAPSKQAEKFLSEVAWREFSYVLLFHNPDLASQNYKPDFDLMPWEDNPDALKAWQIGQTGYPIVDAGMRELWQTGWMHNRVRMIAASFLTKHLMIHWREGEAWFWDTLVDADPANNAASWQWVAGSGADAAPYFRIFNPISQGEKFDPNGDYVRRWCPELKDLPNKYLFSPWAADEATLEEAGVKLGQTYPNPLVDHKAGRERALGAYETLKERRDAA